MNNAWTVEFTRILIVVVSAILFGLTSGLWIIAILVPSALYIGWTLVQIRIFEHWIRHGAQTHLAPNSSGIWQLIVQHIYRIQKKNQERKQRLEYMAARYEATISALPEATVVLNAHNEIEWVNDAALTTLGIDRERDLGLRLDNLIRTHEITSLLENPEKVEYLEIPSPVDQFKTLVIGKTIFGNAQVLITARDISQRIAVQKLRKAFIANASHELRTPLTVISGYLEMLEYDEDVPLALREQMHNATIQAVRMKKILDDLLILSKLEEKGQSKESGEIIAAPEILSELVTDFQRTKAKNSHKIEADIDPLLWVRAVDSEFYSLCQNLLSNAVKYSPKGSLIILDWHTDRFGDACLTIEDNGEGVAPEFIPRLTERFFRVNVNRSRQVGGTGLGLSIVKHITENHGGKLRIESELGRGSKFSACFPSYRVELQEKVKASD